VEARLVADADFRRSVIPRGRRTDEERRRSLGIDERQDTSPEQQAKRQWRDLSDPELATIRAKAEQEENRRLGVDAYMHETPEERAQREQEAAEALEGAEMEEIQEYNETGAWDDPSDLESP
jgi:hypothetical protein